MILNQKELHSKVRKKRKRVLSEIRSSKHIKISYELSI